MTQIKKKEQIEIIIERLAYEIAEQHYDKKHIILLGIKENGCVLADKVQKSLSSILPKTTQIDSGSIQISKKSPDTSDVILDIELSELVDKTIILVDDVINSGRTLFYALKPFVTIKMRSLEVLVLVERKYKKFPIFSDYVGMALNTTLKDHIEVQTEGKNITSINLV